MKTSNFNAEKTTTVKSETKTVQLNPEKPRQFAAVDMWNILRQRKMIYRRSA